MNPPPIPSSARKKPSFPRQAATASLVAPALVVFVRIATVGLHDAENPSTPGPLLIDVVCGGLILIGALLGMVALIGISQDGPKGILGKGIAGLAINGILILIFIANLSIGYQKKLQSRAAALDKVRSAEADVRSSNRKSFDPKMGFTNTDAGKLDQLSSALNDASQNLTGDDALISQAMAAHIARLHGAVTNYQAAALELRTAEVLNHFSSTNKGQFAARREVVERFLRSNAAFAQAITNSENNILADLTKSHVSAVHIKSVIDNFHSTATPINAVSIRIRQCDDRQGTAILAALNLLESEWYKWSVDKTGRLRFDDRMDLEVYNKALQDMHDAGADQLKLQQQLNRLQQTSPHSDSKPESSDL
jgi:hypothetical protein